MYKYLTVAVRNTHDLKQLNDLYEKGYELVSAVAENVSNHETSYPGYVYFTLRIKIEKQ